MSTRVKRVLGPRTIKTVKQLMVSSFLVVNHYFLVNFNYVDPWLPFRVIQTAWIHRGVQ